MSQEFIYYAYTFYTNLAEENNLLAFRGGWVESLGDIARYRIAVSAMLDNQARSGTLPANAITSAALSASHLLATPSPGTPNASAASDKNASPAGLSVPPAHHEQSSSVGLPPPPQDDRAPHQGIPSVGVAAARLMVLEPETERWRQISRDWYFKGLAFAPGSRKLHRHLGLLSRHIAPGLKEKEELRAVYHFMKRCVF